MALQCTTLGDAHLPNHFENICCSRKSFSSACFFLFTVLCASFFQKHWIHLATQTPKVSLITPKVGEFRNKLAMAEPASDTNALGVFAAIALTTAWMKTTTGAQPLHVSCLGSPQSEITKPQACRVCLTRRRPPRRTFREVTT